MRKIGDILSSDEFASLRQQEERLQKLRTAVLQTLSAQGIAARCDIGEFSDGELLLQSSSAADLSTIRQILPTLRESLKQTGFAVNKIRVVRKISE